MGGASSESRGYEALLSAFADDIFALRYARNAVLSHPVMRPIGLDIEPAICRLFIARGVDLIEDGLLRLWGDRPEFADYSKQYPRERIESLVARFHTVGIEVNPDDVADFLGLRYLRNMIVHGRLKEHEETYLQQRQLPTDPAHCGLDLLERATRICARLADHVGRYGILLPEALGGDRLVWERLVSMSDAFLALGFSTDTRGWVRHLLRPGQLPRAWRRNIESLDAWLTTTEVEPGLLDEAIDIGLDSWRELANGCGLPRDRVQYATRILAALHTRRLYSKASLGVDLGQLASEPDSLSGPVGTALREGARFGPS